MAAISLPGGEGANISLTEVAGVIGLIILIIVILPKLAKGAAKEIVTGTVAIGGEVLSVIPAVAAGIVSESNPINTGFNTLYTGITGSPDSLGGDIADGVQNTEDFITGLFK